MKFLILAFCICSSILTTSIQDEKIYWTVEDYKDWFQEMKEKNLEDQLENLREISETEIIIGKPAKEKPVKKEERKGIVEHFDLNRNLAFFIKSEEDKLVPFALSDSAEDRLAFKNTMTTRQVKSIDFLEGVKAQAIYGARATNGIVLITLTDESYTKLAK